MIETYTRCAACKTDARLGVEIHCVLCHTNYPKGEQHRCAVLDAAIDRAEREPHTPFHGRPCEPVTFHPTELVKE